MTSGDAMHTMHLDHWWICPSELLALETLRASLHANGTDLIDDPSRADVVAVLMPAQRVWQGVRGIGPCPIDLSAHLSVYDLRARLFSPFRAVDGPSHLSLYGIPLGAFRNNVVWVNRDMALELGDQPADLDDWLAWLRKAARFTRFPLGLSREDWQVSLLFELVMLSMHGCDFHHHAFGAEAIDGIGSPRIAECLHFLRALRPLVPPQLGAPAWHAAIRACEAGQHAMVVMGDWAHSEVRRRNAAGHASGYESVLKFPMPGTQSWLLYSVDYVVPVAQAGRRADSAALSALTQTLLDAHVQCAFGMVKGSLPTVRDAQETNIDPESWRMFHLAMLCPDILVPSMSLLQGASRAIRDAVVAAVREVLYADCEVTDAHARLLHRCRSGSARRETKGSPDRFGTIQGHHGSAYRLSQPDCRSTRVGSAR